MAEPKEKADHLTDVTEGVVAWSVEEDRIGGMRGESYAVLAPEGAIWIDPLPLTAEALTALERRGRPTAIVLTIQSHQRAAWRYAKDFGIRVLSPRGAEGLDEQPDATYGATDALPGGLTPVALPGPAYSGHGLFWQGPAARVLFASDLITSGKNGLALVPDQYMDAPDQARASVRWLLREPIDVLCPGHGPSLLGDVRPALERLVAGF